MPILLVNARMQHLITECFIFEKGKQGGLAGGSGSMEQQSRIPADREVKDVKTDSKHRRILDDR